MADEFAVVQFNADTGGGTQDITSSAITDFKWGIVMAFGASSTGTPEDGARVSVGIFDSSGSSHVVSAVAQHDNDTSAQAFNRRSNVRCVQIYPTSGTGGATPVASAFAIDRATSGVDNGVRLEWAITPDAAYRMVFLLCGGAPNAQAVGSFTDGTETLGFQADYAIGVPGSANTAGGEGSAQNGFHMGLALAEMIGTISQISGTGALNRDISAPIETTAGLNVGTATFGTKYAAGSTTVVATTYQIDSVTSTEVIGSTPVGATPQMPVLYSELDDTSRPIGVVIESLSSAFSGNQSFTGFGFAPQFVIGMATLVTSQDANDTSDLAASQALFMWDADGQFCGSTRRLNGETITSMNHTDAATLFSAKALALMNESGSVVVDASLVSLSGSGFTLNFSSSADGQLILFGIGFGDQTIVVGETVELSDACLMHGVMAAISETVEISDSCVTETNEMVVAPEDDTVYGAPFQGGSIRGSIFSGGTEAGQVF